MIHKEPLVTVIMPTYNRAEFISESLDSILHQTYSNWECIVVDDGSKDATKEIINTYLDKDKRFNYYFKNNEGAAIARNYGISKSNGSYILPLDSDDLIQATYMEKAIAMFKEDPALKIVYGLAEKIGVERGVWPIPPYNYKLFLIYNMIFNSAMYKRSDFDRVGGYTEHNMFEDWDLWIKILKGGGQVYQIPEVMYYYRTHESNSITTKLDTNKKLFDKSMNELYTNHIDEYLTYIGNPIELERERRELASLVKTADFKVAVRVMKNPIFNFLRTILGKLKRI